MKIILLSIAFCAVITTVAAQKPDKGTKYLKTGRDGQMDVKNNIPANISSSGLSKIFFQSLTACDLIQTFNNPGPLTIFLPPDSAFNSLSKGKLDSLLLPKNKYNLIALLTYHALPGNISSKEIARHIKRGKGSTSLQTISGAWLKAQFDEFGNILLIDETGRRCVLQKSDLKQHNGVIHLVSQVLLPKWKTI